MLRADISTYVDPTSGLDQKYFLMSDLSTTTWLIAALHRGTC